jgi:cytidine deaminase
LPAWIRGPFGDKFAAAVALLDAGDDEAAAALIEYAEAPSTYTAEQVAIFAQVRTQLLAGIASLP